MIFDEIDAIIRDWSNEKKIKLYTMDRDWEVRSFRIDDKLKKGKHYKIWIDPPDSNGKIMVHVCNMDHPHNKAEFSTNAQELKKTLDKALEIALKS